MNVIIQNTSVFKDAIGAISELIDEGKLRFEKDGLKIKETDPTMISMVSFDFKKDNFEKYEIEENAEIAVSISQFNQVLRRLNADNKLQMEYKKEKNTIDLIILGGANVKKFSLPVLELENKKIPDINLDFEISVEMNKKILGEVILDASVVGETLVFAADKDKLSFFSEEDMNRVEMDLDKKNEDVFSFDYTSDMEKLKSKYSLEYLKKMEKGGKLSDVVKLEFGNDYPMKMSFTDKDKKVLISYVLAPRVED
ncbi:MAG: hypothetical protein KAR87_05245 [Candidatus Aenigmarchaeota archaeon]|nr:hypothetical protein [Candidatus Aenigmarchaeota archaeon]